MEPQTSGIKTWQWVVTVIVIIVLIILGIMVFGNKSSEAPAVTPVEDNPATTDEISGVNRIIMSDQYPGNVVYFSSVQLAQPGWVAIHKDNAGKLGAVIGSMHFEKGINPGSKLTLTEPTIEGATYYAVIYTDTDSVKFDVTKNQPLKDSKGSIIMKVFRASASADLELKG